MTNRTSSVTEIMHTDFVTLHPGDTVEAAMRTLVEHNIDAAPVTDENGALVGLLSNTDLIVQEAQLHFPTLISVLGASIEIGHKRFDQDLRAALASDVSQVMTAAVSCEETDTVESAATLMHDHDLAVLPVVRDGQVVGTVARNDILRAILSNP